MWFNAQKRLREIKTGKPATTATSATNSAFVADVASVAEGHDYICKNEDYQERAAIMEYDAGYDRQTAEILAFQDFANRRKG